MADSIKVVEYFYVDASNRAGEGARILAALRDAGVNLWAFSGFPSGRRAQLDFVPAEPALFRAAARKAGWKVVGPKKAFLLQGEDRAGAVAGVLGKLGEAGINVTAIDAVCAGAGRYGALLWVKPPDVRRAARVLGTS